MSKITPKEAFKAIVDQININEGNNTELVKVVDKMMAFHEELVRTVQRPMTEIVNNYLTQVYNNTLEAFKEFHEGNKDNET